MSAVLDVVDVQGCRGLKNLGNTCFMAALVQCLNAQPGFTQYFLGDEYKSDINVTNPLGLGGKLAEEYARLVYEMWRSRDAIVNPLRFKVALQKFAPQFSGHSQHDCQVRALLFGDVIFRFEKLFKESLTSSVSSSVYCIEMLS